MTDSLTSLDHADLAVANLSQASLYRANLNNAYLVRSYLFDANLVGANLADAGLDQALLVDANRTGARLGRASLTGAHLDRADLTGADLTKVAWSEQTRWPEEAGWVERMRARSEPAGGCMAGSVTLRVRRRHWLKLHGETDWLGIEQMAVDRAGRPLRQAERTRLRTITGPLTWDNEAAVGYGSRQKARYKPGDSHDGAPDSFAPWSQTLRAACC